MTSRLTRSDLARLTDAGKKDLLDILAFLGWLEQPWPQIRRSLVATDHLAALDWLAALPLRVQKRVPVLVYLAVIRLVNLRAAGCVFRGAVVYARLDGVTLAWCNIAFRLTNPPLSPEG